MNLRTTTLPSGPGQPRSPRSPWSGRTGPIAMLLGVVIAVAVVVAMLWPSGDSGKEATTAPTSVAVPATAAPDPTAVAEAAVLDAYRKGFEAYVAVASDPNAGPDDPRLAEFKSGDALIAAQESIAKLRKDGQVFTGAVEVHPTVVELGGGRAIVADCGIDGTATVELATGRVLSPPSTEGHAATIELRLDASGAWRQHEFKDERRSCVPPVS